MKLGIIGAMAEEVDGLCERIEAGTHTTRQIAGITFHCGRLEGLDCVIAQSGIGKINAAVCAQILVSVFGVTALENTGIAGSLNPQIDITDIVVSTDAVHHDVDLTGFGYAPGNIPGMDTCVFKADEKLVSLALEAAGECNLVAHSGRIVSGDQFISSAEKKDWLRATFGGQCTEMEGASIAHVAHLNRIPFVILRSISDKADDSAASMDYKQFEKLAADNSVALSARLCRLLSRLEH